ncbi:uncharacterized protein K02A2.6-like [Sabethes cyaneus]|uniref:uncharacterized protein K02A2.6-like n=1 Tax=Sabethes cyaneus TaxID=53552 RepID=UPI00237D5D12|nr:uncharacterized protein K02A2.6-like [Sabethes cyaneus]
MGNADFCSRFPLPENVPVALQNEFIKSLIVSNEFPLDHALIASESRKDSFLQQIFNYMKHGWPQNLDRSLANVYAQHQDLEEVEGCLLYQDRVVIPASLQKQVLRLLHKNHSGITKIKQMARRTVYWHGMSVDIEDFVKTCRVCCQMNAIPKQVPHSNWIPTTKPFARIHADFFYFDKKVFLVIVDSFSKWLEVEYMKFSTDARSVKSKFISVFARFGLPDVVVTDGGPPFSSKELIDFFQTHGIKVMKSPPYNPSSNGQAERMVRVVKEGLKKFLLDPEMARLSMEDMVSYFLFGYRNTCLEDNSSFPSEKLFSFKPKTLLDLIHPRNSFRNHLTKRESMNKPVYSNKAKQHPKYDWIDKLRPGDLVYYKNFRPTDIRRWLEAKFLKRASLNTFQVSVGSRVYLAHRNQLKLFGTRKNRYGLIFARDEGISSNRKRARDDDDEGVDDDADDFLGFAADSFIYRGTDDHPKVCESRSGSVATSLPPEEVDPQEGPSTRQWSQSKPSNPSSSSSVQPRKIRRFNTSKQSSLASKSKRHPSSLRRSTRSQCLKKNSDFIYY